MAIQRFSAIANFGVPIDGTSSFVSVEETVRLFGAYDIEGQDVPVDVIDITPYYWERPLFRFFMSRNSPESPVQIDFLPTDDDSRVYEPGLFGGLALSGTRRTMVPNDQPVMLLSGPSPRFSNLLCIHEAIIEV